MLRNPRKGNDRDPDRLFITPIQAGQASSEFSGRLRSRQNIADATIRAAYAPPALKPFGPVGTLTQAGTGLSSEVMANGMASMSPNQRA